MWTVYCYSKCSTCAKAIAWLDANGVNYTLKPIRDTPPTADELRAGLKAARSRGKDWNSMANTSGIDWRAEGWSEKMKAMSDEERLAAFAGNGSLIRRPFAIHPDGRAFNGFREAEWAAAMLPESDSSPA